MSNTSLLGSYGGQGDSSLMFRNKVINGAMEVSQRYGTADATYTAANIASGQQPNYVTDRFNFRLFGTDYTAGDVATAAQSTDAPPGFANSLRITAKQNVTFSGNRLGAFITQPIEGLNIIDFALGTSSAATVTLSFWVKSNKTGTVSVSLENGAADRSYGSFVTISQAATWEKKTISLQLDTTGTWLRTNGTGLSVTFGVGNNGSWLTGAAGSWSATRAIFNAAQTNFLSATNDYFAITGVQLEAGPTATPFERRPIGTELALAQRYAVVYTSDANNTYGIGTMLKDTTNIASIYINTPVNMRALPSWTVQGTLNPRFIGNTEIITISSTPNFQFLSGNVIIAKGTVTGITNNVGLLTIFGGGSLLISAEL